MKAYSGLIFALCTLALSANTMGQAAKVYKWYDDEGIVQYTDSAPRDRAYTLVTDIPERQNRTTQATQAAPPAVTANQPLSDAELEQRFQAEQARVRAENCKNAQANLKTLQDHARIRMMGDDGQFRYLTPEEKQQQVEQAQEIMADNCD